MSATERNLARAAGNENPRDRGEDGFSMIELLVSMIVLGVVLVPLMIGLGVLVGASETNRSQVDVGAVLRNAAEAIKATPYTACTSGSFPGNYTKAITPAPGGTFTGLGLTDPATNPPKTPTITKITNFDGSVTLWPVVPGNNCSSDPGLQVIELKVTMTKGTVAETQWVVKASVAPTS